ncbi:hypothetical protein KIN20_005856, partial [Parelaphostrongylus tenuis]
AYVAHVAGSKGCGKRFSGGHFEIGMHTVGHENALEKRNVGLAKASLCMQLHLDFLRNFTSTFTEGMVFLDDDLLNQCKHCTKHFDRDNICVRVGGHIEAFGLEIP